MEGVIKVEGLEFSYDREMILRGINFSIKSGEFVSLIGSNGAGKSTLIKLLFGELRPNKGNINIFNSSPSNFKDWHKIGYLAQEGLKSISGFPATAREIVQANLFSQIGLLRFPKKKHKIKSQEALKLVGMLKYEKSLIGNLSGGQKQRVLLARALVNDPELLILDEPTVGVDAKNVRAFYKLISRLNKELGLTILMVTHDLDRSAKYIDRSLCLELGSLVSLSKEEVLEELRHKHNHPPIDIGKDDN